ncbi:hypothetical protein M0805_008421 [Coniferiporia weirii]|nr:hypothetical protein M0805_008421 [Coniferiporia weirii]
MTKTTVLILGATGRTGSSIVDALLDNTDFTVIAAVRPSSASKPSVDDIKSRGVEIRLLDLKKDSVERLVEALVGVETVISTIVWTYLKLQKPLIDAAKKAGVKRFVPCDWATASPRGVMRLHDMKFEIQDYVKESGIGYTFIDVGWWTQLALPITDPSESDYPLIVESTKTVFGTGDVKNAVTDRRDIGKFVARIISDPRTQNRYVFIWGEEVTQNEVFATAERISGKKVDIAHKSEDDLVQMAKGEEDALGVLFAEYMLSIWVRGDNTIENAKKEEFGGALDARELYPDLKVRTLEEGAKELYLN